MKKITLIITIIFTICLLVACTPDLSAEVYEVKDIFTESHVFTYIRDDGTIKTINPYTIEVSDDRVTISTKSTYSEGEYYSSSTFYRENLYPIETVKGNNFFGNTEDNFEVIGKYDDELFLTLDTNNEIEEKVIEVPDINCLDNESLLFTIGALTLENGYVKTINISILDSANVLPYIISYYDTETIETPYDTMECIVVKLMYSGTVVGGSTPETFLYYSNDENRYLLRYVTKNATLELSKVE